MKIKIMMVGLCLLLAGCAGVVPKTPAGWTRKTIETKYLSFAVWEKIQGTGQPLRIYLEGDGHPEPKRPIAFELATKDKTDSNVVYVARPCQYVKHDECHNPALWQEERFNTELVDELKTLIVYLAHKYQAPSLDLIGYDGGGTMAMLLAVRMPVRQVITVGGILDTQKYAADQNISLNGSNPADYLPALSYVSQTHYVGSADSIALRCDAERFVGQLNNPRSARVKIVPSATHTDWKNLVLD